MSGNNKTFGLLTYHDTTNYGAALQTVALVKAISGIGYDVEVVDYQCEEIKRRELPYIIVNGTFRNFLGSLCRFPRRYVKYRNIRRFVRFHCRLSKKYNKNTIKFSNGKYYSFIAGSDILWNLKINGNDLTYFLDFVEGSTKRYSYATSSDADFDLEDLPKVLKCLADFDSISVREEETKKFLNKYDIMQVSVVCDPTMLLKPEKWKAMACAAGLTAQSYVLIYLPNEKCKKDADKFAERNKKKAVHLRNTDSVEKFLGLILNAAVVFTGSYHGLLFSLYFNVPVYFYNYHHPHRMDELKRRFQLENSDAQYKSSILQYPLMDWEYINSQIELYREYSISYLKNMLNF